MDVFLETFLLEGLLEGPVKALDVFERRKKVVHDRV